jgi:hypothetical protein
MSAKKKKNKTVEEPVVSYATRSIRMFTSHEEQAHFELEEMAKLSSIEILQQMRKLINLAYGMHGYDPSKLPQEHTIKIVKK